MNNTKKKRKTIEWERLEVSSRKLEIFHAKGRFHAKMAQKGQIQQEPKRSRRD